MRGVACPARTANARAPREKNLTAVKSDLAESHEHIWAMNDGW
jgi:hypothetical protein